MARVSLNSLLGKNKEARAVVANVVEAIGAPIGIADAEGRLLFGDTVENAPAKYPIQLAEETLGWVSGSPSAEAVAELLTHLAGKEAEKKTLGNEVLHLYREVNLIYNFSEKLAAMLELDAVARMALEQARQLITATGGSVLRLTGVIILVSAAPVTYTAADLKLLNTLALQTAAAIENALLFEKTVQAAKDREQLLALQKELEVASNIQKSIVPRKFPPFPERKDLELQAAMIPAKEVGGDFYDFFLFDAERLGFVIGDVSGKGVPAALFIAVSRTWLKATALQGLPPDQCLEQVNRLLAAESVNCMFVTVFYGILNTRTGEVVYCNAGHNPPFILRHDGRVEAMEMTGGLVLGVFAKATHQAKQIMLQPGDGLLLYTDGITEAMDSDSNEFTESRLEASLKRFTGFSLIEIIQGVLDDVRAFSAGAPQADDMTMLVLRAWP